MATYIVTTKSSNLNVRQQPNTSATIVGKYAKGTEVEVEEIVDGWARVEYNGAAAYCSAEYLTAKEITDADLDALKF